MGEFSGAVGSYCVHAAVLGTSRPLEVGLRLGDCRTKGGLIVPKTFEKRAQVGEQSAGIVHVVPEGRSMCLKQKFNPQRLFYRSDVYHWRSAEIIRSVRELQ